MAIPRRTVRPASGVALASAVCLALGLGACAAPEGPTQGADAPRDGGAGTPPAGTGGSPEGAGAPPAAVGTATAPGDAASPAPVGTATSPDDGAAPRPAGARGTSPPPDAALDELLGRLIGDRGWRLEAGALAAAPTAARVAAVESASAALERVAGDLRALAGRAPQVDLAARAWCEEAARVAEGARAVLLRLGARARTLQDGVARVASDLAAARVRFRLAQVEQARPPTTPVHPDLPLEQARARIEAELSALAGERARLLEALADDAGPGAGTGDATLVVAEAGRLRATAPDATWLPPGVVPALATGLEATAGAAAEEAARLREGLLELARRERETARLTEAAAELELDRRRQRLAEVTRQLAEEQRREEERARLARRDESLDAEIGRLRRLLEEAQARDAQEAGEDAALRARAAQDEATDDPTLAQYRVTRDEYLARLARARAARDDARTALDLLAQRLVAMRDAQGALARTRRGQLVEAEEAWARRREREPLDAIVPLLRAAVAEAEGERAALARAVEQAGSGAKAVEELVAEARKEGEVRALYAAQAPERHRPILAEIEEVRALLERARREEARLRRDEERGLGEALALATQDAEAARALLGEAEAARAAALDARKLDGGAVRAAGAELRALWARLSGEASRLRATLAGDPEARLALARRAGGLAVALAALFALAWRWRRRLARRAEVILERKRDPERRWIPAAGDRAAFYAVYVLGPCVPWVAAGGGLVLAAALLGAPRDLTVRLACLALVLVASRALRSLNHLLFRERKLRALARLRPDNRAPLHLRVELELLVVTPLAAAWILVVGRPELWATEVVLVASLKVAAALGIAAAAHVARQEVAQALRVRVADPGEGFQVVEWFKGLYNGLVQYLVVLLLLDALLVAVLWVSGYADPASFLLGATLRTAATLAGAVLLIALLRRASRAVLAWSIEATGDRPGLQIVLSMLVFVGSRLAELATLGLALVSMYAAWGGDVTPALVLLSSERTAAGAAAAVKIVALLAASYYANRLAAFTIDAFVEQTLRTASPDVARRRDTFAPLVKSAVRYLIVLGTVIYAATLAGIDLMSIVAGLGVIGIAVAFGAQTLVKDVISGVFLIMDDDLAVGDYVMVGAVEGTVENVGVRTTKLRTPNGVLVSLPNGSINQVENFNRGWNRAVVAVDVAYEADVDRAMLVLREVAEEYRRQRPELLIEAPEVQGLLVFGASGVTIRVRVKTAPLAVWQVERELRLRALMAFKDQEIEIPYDRRVVYVRTEGDDAAGLPLAALAGAAGAPAVAAGGATETGSAVAAAQPAPAAGLGWTAPAEPITPARVEEAVPAAARSGAPAERPDAGRAPSDRVPAAPSDRVPAAPATADGGSDAAPLAAVGASDAVPASVEARPKTRRVVLSPEAIARLRDEQYVRQATAHEPEIPAEMQASLEAIEAQRASSDAARAERLGDALGEDLVPGAGAGGDGSPGERDPEGGDEADQATGGVAPGEAEAPPPAAPTGSAPGPAGRAEDGAAGEDDAGTVAARSLADEVADCSSAAEQPEASGEGSRPAPPTA